MSDTVDACPECDTTSGLFSLTAGGHGCRECGARFETPTERPAKRTTNTRKGAARLLADANPDEVGR